VGSLGIMQERFELLKEEETEEMPVLDKELAEWKRKKE